MGYTTQFKGELKFAAPVTNEVLAQLSTFLGKDRRDLGYQTDDIYAGGKYGDYWYHIDYEITPDFSGIQHNDSEKSYCMDGIAQWLIDKMREKYPTFALVGIMTAQGEDIDDRWEMIATPDGRIQKRDLTPSGQSVICPNCDHHFYPDDMEEE